MKQTSGSILSDINSVSAFLEAKFPHAAELIKKLNFRSAGYVANTNVPVGGFSSVSISLLHYISIFCITPKFPFLSEVD